MNTYPVGENIMTTNLEFILKISKRKLIDRSFENINIKINSCINLHFKPNWTEEEAALFI